MRPGLIMDGPLHISTPETPKRGKYELSGSYMGNG